MFSTSEAGHSLEEKNLCKERCALRKLSTVLRQLFWQLGEQPASFQFSDSAASRQQIARSLWLLAPTSTLHSFLLTLRLLVFDRIDGIDACTAGSSRFTKDGYLRVDPAARVSYPNRDQLVMND